MENYHKTLYIDLETTGLPEKIVSGKKPGTTKKQKLNYETEYMEFPYIVSIAWKVDDDESRYYILNQEGRKIPQESIDIHGITDEMAEKSKETFSSVMGYLYYGDDDALNSGADCEIVVGHGLYFDTSIIKANILREVKKIRMPDIFEGVSEMLHKDKRIDTMRSTCKMMRKWPTLSELHMKIFRKGFEPHKADNDVEACYRCYQWLLNKKIVPTWEKLQEKIKEKENG